jgi:hypothetical protein
MAAIQGFFLNFKDDPELAIDNTDLIFKQWHQLNKGDV